MLFQKMKKTIAGRNAFYFLMPPVVFPVHSNFGLDDAHLLQNFE